jgi:hypothetical protein
MSDVGYLPIAGPSMMDTGTAAIHLSDDGVVIVRVRHGAYQSLDDARENLAASLSATAGRRRPLLVDIRTAQPLDSEARHHYSGQTLVDSFTAIAMLVESNPFARMMGNVYLRVARPGVPTQLFTDESQALTWLTRHRL